LASKCQRHKSKNRQHYEYVASRTTSRKRAGDNGQEARKQLGALKIRFLTPLVDPTRRDKRRNVDARNKLNQDCLIPTKLAATHKQNGKQQLTRNNSTVSTTWKKGMWDTQEEDGDSWII